MSAQCYLKRSYNMDTLKVLLIVFKLLGRRNPMFTYTVEHDAVIIAYSQWAKEFCRAGGVPALHIPADSTGAETAELIGQWCKNQQPV